jgi:hypothetical protein
MSSGNLPPIEVDFVAGTIISPTFLNDRQYLEGSASWARLYLASSTVVQVPVTDTGATTIAIGGLPRLITSAIVLDLSGLGANAVTVDIYAVLAGASITGGFTLQEVGHGAAAPGSSRKLGEADWNGHQITALRNLGQIAGHAAQHLIGGDDPIQLEAIMPEPISEGSGTPGVSSAFALADHEHPFSPDSVPPNVKYQIQQINLDDQSVLNPQASVLAEVPVYVEFTTDPPQAVELVAVVMKCSAVGTGATITVLSDHPKMGGALTAIAGLANLSFTTGWVEHAIPAGPVGPFNHLENVAIELATVGSTTGAKVALVWRRSS